MGQEIKVGDIMTRDLISVTPDTDITKCSKLMIKKRVGTLLVKEQNILKGIIRERDIIWAMTKKSFKDIHNIKAGDLAQKKVTTIRPSANLNEALQKMKKSKYRWLPVVDNKEVIGFLTLKDIVKLEPSLFNLSREIFLIRDEKDKLKRKKTALKVFSEGICEECGNFDSLYKSDGRLICESCRDDM